MKVSNTLAGSSNQRYFCPEDPKVEYTGRVFYKVFAGGTFNYSFLFSGKLDSSFCGEFVRNTEIIGWEIVKANVGISKICSMKEMPTVEQMQPLYFNGEKSVKIEKAEIFTSDEITLSVNKDEYVCLEITYKGKKVPQHYENWIAAFLKKGDEWIESNQVVFANMVACDREIKKRIAFLGDSITQGIGVEKNSYKNWCALLAEKLGTEYAFWNLGIGCAMANDAATDGVWLFKAKQNDIVFVCFGVNDISRIKNVEQTKKDLLEIVNKLRQSGCQVILQTIPPFNFERENFLRWKELNAYVREDMKEYADLIFDCVPLLEYEEGKAKYNLHPNEEGCAIWANALYEAVKDIVAR